MPAQNPTNLAAWTPTLISAEALLARVASEFMKTRVLDKSREVTGQRGQQIDLPEVANMATNTVGPSGGVTPQVRTETAVSLAIDTYVESTKDIRDDVKFQSRIDAKKVYAKKAGQALILRIEDDLLALETGLAAAQVVDIAGALTDDHILSARVTMRNADVPMDDWFFYISPGGESDILKIDKFVNLNFTRSGPQTAPLLKGNLQSIYGAEPMSGSRVRVRDVSGTTRTINMLFQREAFAIGVQQDVTVKVTEVDLAQRHMSTVLFGVVRSRGDHAVALRTTNA